MNLPTSNTQETTNRALEDARKRMTETTNEIARLFCERQKDSRFIAQAKKAADGGNKLPIFLPQREQELLAKYRLLAEENHVDPKMMDMLISILISSSISEQMSLLGRRTALDRQRPDMRTLKDELLSLTKMVASSYDEYDKLAEGTRAECLREKYLLQNLTHLQQGDIAVNLGCANGIHVTNVLKKHFNRVIGYDISPDMIASAKHHFPEDEFYIYDLDNGIPLDDQSVELVVANFGAGSEVCENLWSETARVLRAGGRAYFSFYNKDALVTKWRTPWANSFMITINPFNDTLMIPMADDDGHTHVFWIHGKSITVENIYTQANSHDLEVESVESSSPLWDDKPPEFFEHKAAVDSALAYENANAHIPPYIGQYLRVIVQKKHN